MADTTVNLLTALGATPAAGDSIPIWDADAAAYKRVVYSDLVGTDNVSLLGTAQTYSALKTFSSGLTFGDETLSTYNEGTWTPEITGSTTNPTVAYTTQTGQYTQTGNVIFYTFDVHINTIADGSGQLNISLPTTPATFCLGSMYTNGVDLPAGAIDLSFAPTTGGAYGGIRYNVDDAAGGYLQIAPITNGDRFRASGIYFTS